MDNIKRIGLTLGLVTLMLFFTACNGGQGAEAPGNNDEIATSNNNIEAEAGSDTDIDTGASAGGTGGDDSDGAGIGGEGIGGDDSENEYDPRVQELLVQFDSLKAPAIIPISIAMTELLDELNITPLAIPTTSLAVPESFEQLPRIGTTIQPDIEQLVKLQPDVVIVPESLKETLGKNLGSTSLKIAFLPVDSLDEMKISMQVLGILFDKEKETDAFLTQFEEKEQQMIASYKDQNAPKVMFLFGSAESLMFMNEHTFAGSIAQRLGAINVVSDILKVKETYAPLNMESVIEINPDVILLIAHGDPEAVALNFEADVRKNGAWEKLNAFQNKRMKTLDYDLFGSASLTKAIDAYQEMAGVLYE